MKKIKYSVKVCITILSVFLLIKSASALSNPWLDCYGDLSCASKKAGFDFPLRVKNNSVRAMENMIEIKFPLDKKRSVIVRKTIDYEGNSDISGVYETYPVNKTVKLKKDAVVNVRGEKNKFYVVNFAAPTGYYSIYSEQGLKLKDLKRLYKMILKAETAKE